MSNEQGHEELCMHLKSSQGEFAKLIKAVTKLLKDNCYIPVWEHLLFLTQGSLWDGSLHL